MMVGGPATGPNFYGRSRELKELWHYLETDHIRFPGVRRLGKTSILKRLEAEATDHGVLAEWIDVSGIYSAEDLVTLLNQRYPANKIKRFLGEKAQQVRDWFQRIRKIDGKLPDELGGAGVSIEFDGGTAPAWKDDAEALLARLHDQPILILLDEFPVMLNNLIQRDRVQAEQVLNWLRSWRQKPGHCRFIFTGSIGLQFLLERNNLGGWMNDCFPYPLGPFKPIEARDLWRHFAPINDQDTPWQVADAVIDHALTRLGWLSPFFLCLLLDASMRAARERRQECPPTTSTTPRIEVEDVDIGYENLLAERARFHHWEDRLKNSLSLDDFVFCTTALTYLSRNAQGLTLKQLSNRLAKREPDADRRAQRLQDLLVRLTDEGYTSSPDVGQRIQFLSFLLRDWWYRNHV